MTHKEFTLTVKKNIVEDAGYGRKAIHYRVGETFTVGEEVFNKLQSGATIERYTLEGIITLNKYDFENEVQVTTITIENSTRKLGQRKNK
jgi:hypothetical protein